MNDLQLRSALASDAAALTTLMTELGYPTTVEQMSRRLAPVLLDATCLTLVAQSHGSVVGRAGAALARDYERDGLSSCLARRAVKEQARRLSQSLQV